MPMSPKRPRVLQVITHLALGGAEKVAALLQRESREEFEFGLFAVHGQSGDAFGRALEMETRSLQVPLYIGTRVPFKFGGAGLAAAELGRAIEAFQPDIVHLHAEHAELTSALWRRFQTGSASRPAFVRTIHNSVYWRSWPRIGNWTERQLGEAAVAGVSQAACDEYRRHRIACGMGTPTPAAELIYNAVVDSPTAPHVAPFRREHLRLLAAGRFEPQKGFDVLLAALPQVRLPAGVRVELTVAGQGSQQQLLQSLAERAPSSWSVRIVPPLDGLTKELGASDLVIVPSRFEGLGLVSLEATQGGRPVVATRAPGLAETLPPDHPWLAEPGDVHSLADALAHALALSPNWGEVVHRAQSWVARRFSLAAMKAGYACLYQLALRRADEARARAGGH